MSKSGYHFVRAPLPNPFATSTLAEIVQQLTDCGYRCEAGPLELNLAFMELRRRAVLESLHQEMEKGDD